MPHSFCLLKEKQWPFFTLKLLGCHICGKVGWWAHRVSLNKIIDPSETLNCIYHWMSSSKSLKSKRCLLSRPALAYCRYLTPGLIAQTASWPQTELGHQSSPLIICEIFSFLLTILLRLVDITKKHIEGDSSCRMRRLLLEYRTPRRNWIRTSSDVRETEVSPCQVLK